MLAGSGSDGVMTTQTPTLGDEEQRGKKAGMGWEDGRLDPDPAQGLMHPLSPSLTTLPWTKAAQSEQSDLCWPNALLRGGRRVGRKISHPTMRASKAFTGSQSIKEIGKQVTMQQCV